MARKTGAAARTLPWSLALPWCPSWTSSRRRKQHCGQRPSPSLRRGGWLVYLVLAACLSFSAFFELIEWWAALIYGADADAFLATQGDQWDTQWDMFLCLCGAALSLLFSLSYLWFAFNRLSAADGRGLGWFSLFVAITAVPVPVDTLHLSLIYF